MTAVPFAPTLWWVAQRSMRVLAAVALTAIALAISSAAQPASAQPPAPEQTAPERTAVAPCGPDPVGRTATPAWLTPVGAIGDPVTRPLVRLTGTSPELASGHADRRAAGDLDTPAGRPTAATEEFPSRVRPLPGPADTPSPGALSRQVAAERAPPGA